jgi:hypothetical protein
LFDCRERGEQFRNHTRFNTKGTPSLFLVGPHDRFLAVDVRHDEPRRGRHSGHGVDHAHPRESFGPAR